jgi:hypothetical protein
MSEKNQFIITAFHADYPQYGEFTYEQLTVLSSQSAEIRAWYQEKKDTFRLLDQTPSWFTASGGSSSDWDRIYKSTIVQVNEGRKEKATKLLAISKVYKADSDKINSAYQAKFEELSVNPIVQISCLSFEQLPLKIVVKSIPLSSKSERPGEQSPQSAFKAKELLEYQQQLCSLYLADPKGFVFSDHVFVPRG